MLKQHQSKRGAVWEAYNLSVEKPSCKLFKPNGQDVCGAVPSPMAGTSNYWSHLWSHHRQKWYELKQKDGQLNQVGEAELTRLKVAFTKMEAEGASVGSRVSDGHGSEFLSAKLPAREKATMDRVTAEWIVDEDQAWLVSLIVKSHFMFRKKWFGNAMSAAVSVVKKENKFKKKCGICLGL